MHMQRYWVIALLCASGFLNGCGKQQESQHQASDRHQATHEETIKVESPVYPEGDVRRYFIAKAKPLFDGDLIVRVWVSGQGDKNEHEIIISQKGHFTHLTYNPSGSMFTVVSKYGESEPDSIWMIDSKNRAALIAQSDARATYQTDNGSGTDYRRLSGIAAGVESLVVLQELYNSELGNYPYLIDKKFNLLDQMPFDWLLGNQQIKSSYDLENYYTLIKDQGKETYIFGHISTNKEYGFYFLMEVDGKESWLRWDVSSGVSKFVMLKNAYELPPDAYLVSIEGGKYVNSIPGPDGYIYAVEQGKGKQDPDRIIRIGDPGKSSLRQDASRVAIASFKHGELTGSIAFSPKGELAVGADNRIYLITPGPAGKPQPEKAP